MTTTGTAGFNLDVAELVEEAYERAGLELRSGYDLRTARRSLNLLTIEWANQGINMWTIEQGSIPLVAGTATYDLPNDTIDLLEHVIRQNGIDLTTSRISVSTYATIPNKSTQGRPIQLFVHRRSGATYPTLPSGTVTNNPTVTVWPVPDGGTYSLVYWRLRRVQDIGDGIETPDIPFRFLPAMVAGLAYYIAMKNPEAMDRVMMLKTVYDEVFQSAKDEDREKASVRFVPRQQFLR
jgi:hypothetical protein